jgi:hypothetical protein
MHDGSAPGDIAAGLDEQRDAAIVECHALPAITFDNGEHVPATPQVVAFALFESAERFPRLPRTRSCCLRIHSSRVTANASTTGSRAEIGAEMVTWP